MWATLHIVQTDTFLAASVELPPWVRRLGVAGLAASILTACLSVAASGYEAAPLVVGAVLVGSASALGWGLSGRRSVLTLSADGLTRSGPPHGEVAIPLSDLEEFVHVPLQRSVTEGIPDAGNHVGIVVRGKSTYLLPLHYGQGLGDARLVELTRQLNTTLAHFQQGNA